MTAPAPTASALGGTGAASSPLKAVTRRLDHDVDLIEVAGATGSLWTDSGFGFAGRGEARRIDVPRDDPAMAAKTVQAALDAIEIVADDVDLPGSGPVALGALPFSPDQAGSLVVPRLIVARQPDGTRWITAITPDGAEPSLDASDAPPPASPPAGATGVEAGSSGFRVTSDRDPAAWCAALVQARHELQSELARKVVLARAVTIESDQPIGRQVVLERLARAYPSCLLFADGDFVGASPELLVSRVGDLVRSQPMAGTAPRSSDPGTDARLAADLLSSTKNRAEHRYTIDMVHETLLPWCSYLDEDAEPRVVAMANVQHLATQLEGRLSSPAASVIELMTALHPTPAVNGSPRTVALEMIDRFEGLDRGQYAGPVGWVDRHGNGSWAVGIRSAVIGGTTARVFAGVGVVADSDPAAELAETRSKLQAVLGAIIQP